ncbi:hypothetical protein JX265_006274 [Neoarthrinium moseri]|uniref:Uncharacterized protein n=1 Tax=Neoarthrinium moseri TaxID=1658444 RepID=A0A9P9WMC2_9PEZI|nr:uncharacterized protein JN550_011966 [Neoarthrinium moseri]KAI1840169.1 hypothetical protein JX266_013622 [Neoarthrinium moseri]KAI1859558.1 hypothetical protein JN550_011966 [Neoarthrinium moseri]KAI1870104.1 hypothetical protein JX265_006274 [Neoarthrinium moseri]
MANDHQWILDRLDGVLPDQTLQFLSDHVLARETPFQATLRWAQSAVQRGAAAAWPVVQPVLARVSDVLSDSPDIVFVMTLVGIAFAALQIALWVHRVMMFWTRLVSRLLLWAVVAALLAAVWQRGPEAVLRDAVVLGSKAVGYATIVKNIWLAEYDKYDSQTKNSRKAGRARGTGR